MVSSRAEGVLRRIERSAERSYLPIVGPERGRVLVELVRRIRPRRILEVGTLLGYSAILIGKELEGDAEIVTIEIDEEEAETARQNIREADIRPVVKVLVGDAFDVIPGLDGRFDLVFLDAAKSEYLIYLRLVEDKLHKGSVIVADNAGICGYSMRSYLDYVRNSEKYESHYVPVDGDGLEISKKL